MASAVAANLDAEDVPLPAWSPVPFVRPADFAAYMQSRHAWPRDRLDALFADYRPNAQVIRLMEPAPQGFKRSWQSYRKRFIDPKRIAAGLAFWSENQSALERASKRFGVPAYVIVGIIGVESIYGRNTGNFQVLDALATLSFDYPRRGAFFARELEHFLLWTQEQGLDPKALRGSFAGAIGLPQFMPGSIRRHAVDFDGDGSIDLAGSSADAIGSVASFLKRHGWRSPSAQKIRIQLRMLPDAANEEALAKLLEAGWQPRLERREIERAGLGFPKDASPKKRPAVDQQWAVYELPNADAPSTWIAADHNFWVITRYNQSPFYAMAVLELGESVRDERRRQTAKPGDHRL
ncbi:MAG: lytic murein transglycosylase B, partial [Betaproteobacteria bacterium]|nr:lytic murein transglycosylase B [Betaproteobacteria bacterium]